VLLDVLQRGNEQLRQLQTAALQPATNASLRNPRSDGGLSVFSPIACLWSECFRSHYKAAKRSVMTRFALFGAGVALAHVALTKQHASEKIVIHGFSARRHVLGQKVYNDKGQLVGEIEDLILAKRSVSHVIMGVGGFLGLATYTVAVPVADFIRSDEKIVMPRATEEAVRAMPRFQYAQIAD
jgi:PRC-barrel domain